MRTRFHVACLAGCLSRDEAVYSPSAETPHVSLPRCCIEQKRAAPWLRLQGSRRDEGCFFIWLTPKVRARCDVNRPVIVGAAAAAIVVAAIVLTFFIDRKPDDPVRKPSSLWEREAPAQALVTRSPNRHGGGPRTAIEWGGQEAAVPLPTAAG